MATTQPDPPLPAAVMPQAAVLAGAAREAGEADPDGRLRRLLAEVRSLAGASEAPDPLELSRMWLVSADASGATGGSVFVAEVHPAARLLHTADGLAWLTSPGRVLLGVGFAIPELGLPGPNDLDAWLTAELAAHDSGERPLGRSEKWRLQRLQRQLTRAARGPRRWATFILRNDVSYQPKTVFGVWLASGERAAEVVDASTGQATAVPADDPFWDHNDYTVIGRALQERGGGA